MILRDDHDADCTASADSTLERRVYYAQNWRADVVAMVSSAGLQVEQARYSAYGVPFGLPAGDVDSDGDVDATDLAFIDLWIMFLTYDVRADLDLDGDVDTVDRTRAAAFSGTTLGRGVLTRASIGNRFGYAGYNYDEPVLRYHVRNRVYDPFTGRWLTRDPIGYAAGSMSLYGYVASMPMVLVDPFGLFRTYIRDFRKGPPRNYEFDPDDEYSPGIDVKNIYEVADDLVKYCKKNGYITVSLTTLGSHSLPGVVEAGDGESIDIFNLRDIKRLRDNPLAPMHPQHREKVRRLDHALKTIFAYSDKIEFFCCNVGAGPDGAEFGDLLDELYKKPVKLPKTTVRYNSNGRKHYDRPGKTKLKNDTYITKQKG